MAKLGILAHKVGFGEPKATGHVVLPRALSCLNSLTSKWQDFELLAERGLSARRIDSAWRLGFVAVAQCDAHGVAELRPVAWNHLCTHLPKYRTARPLVRWNDDEGAIVWVGLPYENPLEPLYSTSVGCIHVLEMLDQHQSRVIGLLPYVGESAECARDLHDLMRVVLGSRMRFGVVGGDHSVTWSLLVSLRRLLNGTKKIHYIHIDAHHDLCGFGATSKYSSVYHSSFVAALLESRIVNSTVFVGCRDGRSDFEAAELRGFDVCSVADESKILPCADRHNKHIHMSIDLDILDASEAPGVSNPLGKGWSLRQLKGFLEMACSQLLPDSVSIVEVTHNCRRTAAVAAEIIRLIETSLQN